MIIELVGLPGAGKTTLATALAREGAVVIGAPTPSRIALDAVLFSLAHPLTALWLKWFILLHAPRGMRYALLMNGFVTCASRYRLAQALSRAGKVAVLDQGFFQLLVSLGTIPPSLLRAFQRPDVLVVVSAPVILREERMQMRGRTPRAEYGNEWRSAWETRAEKALTLATQELTSFIRVEHIDGSQDLRQERVSLLQHMTIFPYRTRPLRNLFKFLGALIAYGVRTIARIGAREPEVVVLMYHAIDRSGWKLAVTPDAFERQMAYLAKKRLVVQLTDVVAYVKGKKNLTHRSVAVTFDDGYRDVLTTTLPILERYNIPATVFVPTDLSASTGPLQRLSWDELRTLSRSGLVTIESHARTHRKLSTLAVHDIRTELEQSVSDIESEIGKKPHFFAYPFGDRSPAVEASAREIYDASFSITEGTIRRGDDLARLKRVQIDGTMGFHLFRLRLTEALDWNRRIVNALRVMMPI